MFFFLLNARLHLYAVNWQDFIFNSNYFHFLVTRLKYNNSRLYSLLVYEKSLFFPTDLRGERICTVDLELFLPSSGLLKICSGCKSNKHTYFALSSKFGTISFNFDFLFFLYGKKWHIQAWSTETMTVITEPTKVWTVSGIIHSPQQIKIKAVIRAQNIMAVDGGLIIVIGWTSITQKPYLLHLAICTWAITFTWMVLGNHSSFAQVRCACWKLTERKLFADRSIPAVAIHWNLVLWKKNK